MPPERSGSYAWDLPKRFLTSIAACSRACCIRSSLWIMRSQLAQVVPVVSSTSLISVPVCTVRSWLQQGHLKGILLIIVDLSYQGAWLIERDNDRENAARFLWPPTLWLHRSLSPVFRRLLLNWLCWLQQRCFGKRRGQLRGERLLPFFIVAWLSSLPFRGSGLTTGLDFTCRYSRGY